MRIDRCSNLKDYGEIAPPEAIRQRSNRQYVEKQQVEKDKVARDLAIFCALKCYRALKHQCDGFVKEVKSAESRPLEAQHEKKNPHDSMTIERTY